MVEGTAWLVKRQVALILAFSTKAALAAKTVTSWTGLAVILREPLVLFQI
jgi:hypothetical protein